MSNQARLLLLKPLVMSALPNPFYNISFFITFNLKELE